MKDGIINLFSSQKKFLEYLQNTRPSGVHYYLNNTDNPDSYEGEEKERQLRKNVMDYRFTGIHDREEAIEMLKNGYQKPLEHFKKDVYERYGSKEEVYMYAPFGPRYNVGLAAQGISNCFRMPKTIDSINTKVVNLCIDTGVSWNVSKEKLEEYGINICKAIKSLEKNNYRINLYSGVGTALCDWLEMVLIQLKKADQKLNVANLCYPIAHPSFLRCLVFEWQDKVEGGADMGYGRGYPTLCKFNPEEVEELIKRTLGYNMIYVNIQYASTPEAIIDLVRRRAAETRRKH